MPRICHFTGKKTTFGRRISRSGAAIRTGGFGLKTTGIAKRMFKPNLHKMTILVDGETLSSITRGDTIYLVATDPSTNSGVVTTVVVRDQVQPVILTATADQVENTAADAASVRVSFVLDESPAVVFWLASSVPKTAA